MKNRIDKRITIGIGCFLILVMFLLISSKTPTSRYFDSLIQKIVPIPLDSKYYFADEIIPIENFDVSERLERELLSNTYQHTSTILHLKLAKRYFPFIEEVFEKEGIPDDLKYLAVAESSLRNSMSSAGAKGFWQFMNPTAKELGLEVTEFVDERNHFEKSTFAACQYLKKIRQKFGSWTLVAAAYNMGPNGLQSAIEEQKEDNYYDLNLSDETNRYVFRILAIKEIMQNPEKYGFYMDSNVGYEKMDKYKSVVVDTTIESLADFAHDHGITYRKLKLYNPWLLKSSLPNKTRKVYEIRIPD